MANTVHRDVTGKMRILGRLSLVLAAALVLNQCFVSFDDLKCNKYSESLTTQNETQEPTCVLTERSNNTLPPFPFKTSTITVCPVFAYLFKIPAIHEYLSTSHSSHIPHTISTPLRV